MTAGYGLAGALSSAQSPRGGQVRIVKLRQIAFVAARPTRGAFEMLEPCEGRLSCTVLRGGSGGNAASLPARGFYCCQSWF